MAVQAANNTRPTLFQVIGHVVGRFRNITFADFDGNRKIQQVKLSHFCPINTWEDHKFENFFGTKTVEKKNIQKTEDLDTKYGQAFNNLMQNEEFKVALAKLKKYAKYLTPDVMGEEYTKANPQSTDIDKVIFLVCQDKNISNDNKRLMIDKLGLVNSKDHKTKKRDDVSPEKIIKKNIDWAKKFCKLIKLEIDENPEVYVYDSNTVLRFKHAALFVASPLVNLVGQVLNVANKVSKIVLLSHFWYSSKSEETKYNFTARLKEFSTDVAKVVFSPLLYIGQISAPLYGLIRPKDGRKLYATFERFVYGDYLIAPCFQPNPQRHLFGGDLNASNVW